MMIAVRMYLWENMFVADHEMMFNGWITFRCCAEMMCHVVSKRHACPNTPCAMDAAQYRMSSMLKCNSSAQQAVCSDGGGKRDSMKGTCQKKFCLPWVQRIIFPEFYFLHIPMEVQYVESRSKLTECTRTGAWA
jgi:hypothetical protein